MPLVSCSFRPPHNTFTEVSIGQLSMLFSYGKVVGFARNGAIYVRSDVNAVTQRHLNKWRDFRSHTKLDRAVMNTSLLALMQQELTTISNLAAIGVAQPVDTPQKPTLLAAGDEGLDDELERLDDLEDDLDDGEDDDDDDDFDDDLDDDEEDEVIDLPNDDELDQNEY